MNYPMTTFLIVLCSVPSILEMCPEVYEWIESVSGCYPFVQTVAQLKKKQCQNMQLSFYSLHFFKNAMHN